MFHSQRLLFLGLVFAVTGCGGLVTGSPEEHHDEEHLEHHVPAHRPAGFTEAVDQIEQRFQAIRSGGHVPDESLSELSDILSWLPEIAADSDMRRKDWEQVDALSSQMLQSLTAWQSAGSHVESRDAENLAQAIGQLKELRGKEHPAE